MAVRSKRLWGPTAVGAASQVLYTCPAGETALVKCVTATNTAALSNTVLFRLNSSGGNSQLWTITLAGSSATIEKELFVVLHPGDTLHAAATAAQMVITGFGAELEGVAD